MSTSKDLSLSLAELADMVTSNEYDSIGQQAYITNLLLLRLLEKE